jgi:TATA-binding protein-associated factor
MTIALLGCRTQAALAGAVTMLRCLPEKLNPVIKPLMESIKKEDNEQLQVC